MREKQLLLTVLTGAVIFTTLFHRQALGLNLLIYETILFSFLLFTKQYRMSGLYPVTLGVGMMITILAAVINHSGFAYFVNILLLILFVGVLIYPGVRSLWSALGLSIANAIYAQQGFVKNLAALRLAGKSIGKSILRLAIYILPVIIILIFISIYSNANPVFNDLVNDLVHYLNLNIAWIFEDLDLLIIFTFIAGLMLSSYIFIRVPAKMIIDIDKGMSDTIDRKKMESVVIKRKDALSNEYRSGIFLFLILNAILLILNIIDIKWVWLNFSWEGQYLKQFVHEGTYLLIFSILISIVLVLFYFRGALNLFPRNRFLKYLSLIWLAQNTVLALSVAIRNYWYIDYFSLAYLRIGVIIFLIMVLVGLYTVAVKVRKEKSLFYLLNTNAYTFIIIMSLTAIVNWDTVIAKYNFKHSSHSFLHLDFMSQLPDKCLPYLDRPLNELQAISEKQSEKFPFEKEYMTPEEYFRIIDKRKKNFKEEWNDKGFLSWNLAEHSAYKKLFSD